MMNKKKKILIASLAAFVLFLIGFYFAHQSPSIEYLKKNPEALRVNQFKNTRSLEKTLRALLPIGKKREKVDKLLLEQARLQYRENKNWVYYIAERNSWFFEHSTWSINAEYNQKNILTQLSVNQNVSGFAQTDKLLSRENEVRSE